MAAHLENCITFSLKWEPIQEQVFLTIGGPWSPGYHTGPVHHWPRTLPAKLQFSRLMGYALRDLATFTVRWGKAREESSFCFLDEIPRIMV